MPIMRNEDLSGLVAMIDRQLDRKRSLEAREKSLEKQLEKWRMLLIEKMAAQNPPCTCCVCSGRSSTAAGPSGPRYASPSRPKTSHGHRRSRSSYDEHVCPATLPTNRCSCSPDATFSMTTQWTNDYFNGATGRQPPPSPTECLCGEESGPVISRLTNLADDEIRIRAAIQETENRIMTTCNAICALKQVIMPDVQEDGPATPAAVMPVPDTPAAPVADTVEPDALVAVRTSSLKEASVDLGVVRKSLDGAENVVNTSHTSKGDLSSLKDNLTNVEMSIMSAHLSLAAAPLPDSRLDSIVSYKTPIEVIDFMNEIDSTKHRLSILVKHSKECNICTDIFKPTFDRIDEELTGLTDELRRYHTNNPPKE